MAPTPCKINPITLNSICTLAQFMNAREMTICVHMAFNVAFKIYFIIAEKSILAIRGA